MVTIANFDNPEEAHLLRTRLEAIGIPAFVLDDNFIQLDSIFTSTITGVRVQVGDEDEQEVRAFLAADKEMDASELPPE